MANSERGAEPKILIILASTREGRAGERYARWFEGIAERRDDLQFQLVDLRDWPLPFFNSAMPPSTGSYDPAAEGWRDLIDDADGYVIVTPEYNRGYPAVLKNALDHLYREWNRKPVGFVSYGGSSGGLRAVEQLRLVAVELQLVPLRHSVSFAYGRRAWEDNGQLKDPALYEQQAKAMLDELAFYARVLKQGRQGVAERPRR